RPQLRSTFRGQSWSAARYRRFPFLDLRPRRRQKASKAAIPRRTPKRRGILASSAPTLRITARDPEHTPRGPPTCCRRSTPRPTGPEKCRRRSPAAADDIRHGRTTPLELLDACLAHIDRYEPRVRAWVFVARELAQEAAVRLTEEQRQGRWRGPLHGIPIAIKDIIDVFDWPTAAGSRLWANSIARQDATVVRRLRAAGAVFVGTTVTPQSASFAPPPTRNPWDLDRTPGGSSSGSAAALACGMCLGALGSQTGGSITRPAAFCGVAGLKPTYGRVSLHGMVPLAHSMDHVGVLALCVRDLALMLEVITGPEAA